MLKKQKSMQPDIPKFIDFLKNAVKIKTKSLIFMLMWKLGLNTSKIKKCTKQMLYHLHNYFYINNFIYH